MRWARSLSDNYLSSCATKNSLKSLFTSEDKMEMSCKWPRHLTISIRKFSQLGDSCSVFVRSCLAGKRYTRLEPGNTKGGNIPVVLTSCLTGLESAL
jgi:hypothetical protein